MLFFLSLLLFREGRTLQVAPCGVSVQLAVLMAPHFKVSLLYCPKMLLHSGKSFRIVWNDFKRSHSNRSRSKIVLIQSVNVTAESEAIACNGRTLDLLIYDQRAFKLKVLIQKLQRLSLFNCVRSASTFRNKPGAVERVHRD